jgi:hypothetical protein
MMESLINKVLLVTFIICVFNVGRHIWNVVNNLREDVPTKYVISQMQRFLLGLSLAYIITSIITGVQI